MIDRDSPSVLIRVCLLGAFHVERRQDETTWKTLEPSAWGNSYARSLLKYLLCASKRKASRSDIIDNVWPERELSLAEKYLNNASSRLYRLFHYEGILTPFGSHGRTGYELAGQEVVWTDSDECEALLRDAERLGRTSSQALPLLEQASRHFERGSMLEGESGQWSLASRAEKETVMRCCLLWLVEAYEAQGMLWHVRGQYRTLLETNPLDEDVLCRLLAMLHRQGMTHDARSTYEEAKHRFIEYGLSLSETTNALAEKLLHEPVSLETYLVPFTPADMLGRNGQYDIKEERSKHVTKDIQLSPEPVIQGQSLPLAHPSLLPYTSGRVSLSLPDLDILMISRRQVLHDILNAACAGLALSPYALLPQDSRERLVMITKHPSYVDSEALSDLSAITQRYWGLSKNASIDLLSGIAGHFTTIAQLLQESHPTPIYEKLCELASENAMLLGKTFHDIREYDLAYLYYKFSLRIAQDTHNTDLWANGVGRIALLLIYWGQPQQALPLLHKAQKNEIHNQRLKPWLSAIEAEIHAMMGNVDDSMRSLEQAKNATLPISLDDDIYGTGFNPSRAAGYEGACFVRLRQPERALPALEEAFALCDPTSLRRRSTLLADIGTVHAQLGDAKKACSLILQSLDMTMQTKSLVVLQRIYKGRAELDPWKESTEVKTLDDRVFEMLMVLTKLKEHI